jgi:hypothetical protein
MSGFKLEFYHWMRERGANVTVDEFLAKWEEIELKRLEVFKSKLSRINK